MLVAHPGPTFVTVVVNDEQYPVRHVSVPDGATCIFAGAGADGAGADGCEGDVGLLPPLHANVSGRMTASQVRLERNMLLL
jgi:hypothetical protein